MTAKPSTIKCPKCGYQPNIISDTCLKCGAQLEKACGECGAANSVEKNYCAQCGAVLSMQPPPKEDSAPGAPPSFAGPQDSFKLEMESIQDTVSERATSFRRKAPEPGQAPTPPPPPPAKPGATPPPPPRPLGKGSGAMLSPDSSRLPAQSPFPVAAKKAPLKRLAGPVITVLLTGVLLGILYMIVAPSLPKLRLVMTAKSYLSYISEGNFAKAYGLLSSNSKAACSLDEYVKNSNDYYSKAPSWQFKDVQVFAMTNNSAMIRYKLKEEGGEWKDDYISFVREHNRWMRPYIWILFQPIDDAIKRRDFPQALFLAQKLYLTDPVDPRTSGYLCAAEFFMGLHEKAVESCKRTLDNASIYPVGYTSEELFQFGTYYADSLRFLQRDRVALQEYDKLLKWPGITADQQCPLHLNRADSYVYLGDHERALQEIMTASTLCTQSPSKEDARKRLYYMSGSAGNIAIAFAQNSRLQQGMPKIIDLRKSQREDMKKRLGPRNARYLPKDQWFAVHTTGPEYRVFLREETLSARTRKTETRDLYVFLINLWTNKAKIEKSPSFPAQPKDK